MEGKIAVLGDTDFVMPFAALGVDTFAVSDAPRDVAESADKIIQGNYALVIVPENIAPSAGQAFSDYENQPTPCLVVVPFTAEPTGVATKTLGEALKIATGINILQKSQG